MCEGIKIVTAADPLFTQFDTTYCHHRLVGPHIVQLTRTVESLQQTIKNLQKLDQVQQQNIDQLLSRMESSRLGDQIEQTIFDSIVPINRGSPNRRKPHPCLPPLQSLLLPSAPECLYRTSRPPNPSTTHNAVTLVTVPPTSEHTAPKPLVSNARAPC